MRDPGEDGAVHRGPPRTALATISGLLSIASRDFCRPDNDSQVLFLLSTKEQMRDQLPAGVGLQDLGERLLKDLFRPERVFQLVAPDLPTDFPPLKTLDARLNNLPVQPTPLVGREKEIAEVCRLLRDAGTRLLTLTGPEGIGKTRLGLQSAAELLDEYESGVYSAVLAPVTAPSPQRKFGEQPF